MALALLLVYLGIIVSFGIFRFEEDKAGSVMIQMLMFGGLCDTEMRISIANSEESTRNGHLVADRNAASQSAPILHTQEVRSSSLRVPTS